MMYYPAQKQTTLFSMQRKFSARYQLHTGVLDKVYQILTPILFGDGFKFTNAVVYISIEKLFCQPLIFLHSKLHVQYSLVVSLQGTHD
jgi:hypothetical protein